jgi:hypothetical protein
MAASYHIMKNGVATAVTSQGKKTALAHGNPSGEVTGVGKFTTKVRSTGPISGN